MAEYRSYNISFSTELTNGEATGKVQFSDDETEYEDKLSFKFDINELDKLGGSYVDNIAEFLVTEAIRRLVEQKKQYRQSVFNIYDDIQS